MVQVGRFVTLVWVALALSLTSAHVLELPPRMQYGADLYAAVNPTLYRQFATVGVIYGAGQIVAAGLLAVLVRRRRRAFRWTLAGTALLVLWLLSWLIVVAPVNDEVARTLHASPDLVPAVWMRLRERWEHGHAVGFVFQLLGFCVLLIAVLLDASPESHRLRFER